MINKYSLNIGKETIMQLPAGSTARYVGTQNGLLYVWIELGHTFPIPYTFDVIGTGWDVPIYNHYVGTTQIGGFVWHVYQV